MLSVDGLGYSSVYVGGTTSDKIEDKIKAIENIIGGSGKDVLLGDAFDNSLSGGDNNDALRGNGGSDTLRGGLGNDELRYSDSEGVLLAGEIYDGGDGTDTLYLHRQTQGSSYTQDLRGAILLSIEAVTWSGVSDADPGAGGTATIQMLSSQFAPGAVVATAVMQAAAGSDRHNVVDITMNTATLSLATLVLQNFTDAQDQFVIHGTEANETIVGSLWHDSIAAGGGDDFVIATNGNDTIDGGAGTGDWISFVGRTSGVNITLHGSAAATVSGSAASLTITNVENVEGTAGQDLLEGDDNDNIFRGRGATDTIHGGNGNDTADYSENAPDANMNLMLDDNGNGTLGIVITTNGANFSEDVLTSIENLIGGAGADTFTGGTPDNRFWGNDGDDTLNGGGGNDTPIGGFGNDSLTGGIGADRFRFDTAPSSTHNVDHIADFGAGDKIEIDDAIFAVGPTLATNEFISKKGHAFTTTTQRLIYDTTAHELWYDANGSATSGAGAIKIAVFDNHPASLALGDFVIV